MRRPEWPRTGVPTNPGAWLITAAKRRAINAIRRDKMRERKHEDTDWPPIAAIHDQLRVVQPSRHEFEAAAKLTRNAREAAFLLARADACD